MRPQNLEVLLEGVPQVVPALLRCLLFGGGGVGGVGGGGRGYAWTIL